MSPAPENADEAYVDEEKTECAPMRETPENLLVIPSMLNTACPRRCRLANVLTGACLGESA